MLFPQTHPRVQGTLMLRQITVPEELLMRVSVMQTVTYYKYPHGIKICTYFSIIFANSDEMVFVFIFTAAES